MQQQYGTQVVDEEETRCTDNIRNQQETYGAKQWGIGKTGRNALSVKSGSTNVGVKSETKFKECKLKTSDNCIQITVGINS